MHQYTYRKDTSPREGPALSIESKLQERVKGQDRAITTLSDAIIESRSGLSDPKKPIGSFFFLGPTGTGKQNSQNHWPNYCLMTNQP